MGFRATAEGYILKRFNLGFFLLPDGRPPGLDPSRQVSFERFPVLDAEVETESAIAKLTSAAAIYAAIRLKPVAAEPPAKATRPPAI